MNELRQLIEQWRKEAANAAGSQPLVNTTTARHIRELEALLDKQTPEEPQLGDVVEYGYDLENIGILGEFESPQYRVYDGESSTLWRPRRVRAILPNDKPERIVIHVDGNLGYAPPDQKLEIKPTGETFCGSTDGKICNPGESSEDAAKRIRGETQ